MDYSKRKNQNKQLVKGNYNEKLYSRVWLYVLRVICVALLIGTFAVAGVALGTFMGMLDGVPEVSLNSLSIDRQTTTIVDQTGAKITDIQTAEQRTSISIDEMPTDLLNAVVAIEDARFYQHNGIDLEGILRAGVANLKSGGTAEGGSTLTQQMIKKLVLTSDQTWKRKIQEWYLALQLEYKMNQEYGKDRTKALILESYLNYNYLGNNCYGVEAASQRYFGKPAHELNLAESALIAGLFNAPSAYDPIENYENHSRQRQVQVLDAMLKQGYITQEQYDEAKADDVFGRIAAWNETYEAQDNDIIYSYFVDSVISQAQKDLQEQLNCSELEAYNTLFYGGLTVYITQDARIQGIVDSIFADPSNFQATVYYQLDYRLTIFDEKDASITDNYSMVGLYGYPETAMAAADQFKAQYITPDMVKGVHYVETTTITEEPQYSMTIIDQSTGHVVALAGGRGEKTTNMALNRAVDATRQPGSTFQILASYAAAIDAGGMGPGSVEDDAPMNWNGWSPENWWNSGGSSGGFYYRGFCTLREGVASSLNIVTARAMRDVGVDTNFEYVKNFGISTLQEEIDENGYTDKVGPLCLGSGSVTNMELCGAYASIANGGEYIEPTLYTKITDRNGNTLLENTPETHRVIKETTAWLLTDMMRDVITGANGGTGTACNFDPSMAIAGKTGTTSDSNDFAFVGFTPYYTCAVMSGFDYVKYSTDYNSIDPDGAGLLDSSAHKYLWNRVMAAIHEPLETIDSFTQPEGLTQVTLCMDSGKLAGPYCALDARGNRLHTEWCAADSVPTEVCDRHVSRTVCSVTNKIANQYCPSTKTQAFITRTAQEIAEIGEENLGKIQDNAYTAYDTVCTLHNENFRGEESSVVKPNNNSSSSSGNSDSSSDTGGGDSSDNNSSDGGGDSDSSPNSENTGGE